MNIYTQITQTHHAQLLSVPLMIIIIKALLIHGVNNKVQVSNVLMRIVMQNLGFEQGMY